MLDEAELETKKSSTGNWKGANLTAKVTWFDIKYFEGLRIWNLKFHWYVRAVRVAIQFVAHWVCHCWRRPPYRTSTCLESERQPCWLITSARNFVPCFTPPCPYYFFCETLALLLELPYFCNDDRLSSRSVYHFDLSRVISLRYKLLWRAREWPETSSVAPSWKYNWSYFVERRDILIASAFTSL